MHKQAENIEKWVNTEVNVLLLINVFLYSLKKRERIEEET